MNKVSICALWVVFGLAAGPLAADEKPAAPPKAPSELSQLAYFAGNWTCKGKTFATPMGPEHPTEGAVAAMLALNGFWYLVHYDESKTAANPAPYHTAIVMGYEPGQKLFVSHCFDSMGGACSQTSPGWKGDVLTFEGTMLFRGEKGGARDTFTKVSPTELRHRGEMQGPDGKWMPTDEETCTKGAKAPRK